MGSSILISSILHMYICEYVYVCVIFLSASFVFLIFIWMLYGVSFLYILFFVQRFDIYIIVHNIVMYTMSIWVWAGID